MIDTSRSLEIHNSPWKMLGLTVGGIVGAVGLGFMALHDDAPGSFREFVGYFGALLFGLGALVAIWRWVRQRGPVVTITPDGIRDPRLAAEFIPWLAVRRISTYSVRGRPGGHGAYDRPGRGEPADAHPDSKVDAWR
jgi:hypothetical protein